MSRRVLLLKAGYVNHMKSHIDRPLSSSVPQRPDSTVCVICDKVCRSASGLKRLMVEHKDSISHVDPINPFKILTFVCHVCHRPCKSAAGLQSHLRTHEGLFDAEHETWNSNHLWRCCNHHIRGAINKFPDFFLQALKIHYVIAIHLMRWLTNLYDFSFKWTATAAIGIHPTKAWLSQLLNFKNAIWTWGHFRRMIGNKILFSNLEKMPQKQMECFRLLFNHLAWIEHQFLSNIRDSRKVGSLWGMMRGVGGVRKSIHQSWLAKQLGLGLLCWGFKGVPEEIPSEEASTL